MPMGRRGVRIIWCQSHNRSQDRKEYRENFNASLSGMSPSVGYVPGLQDKDIANWHLACNYYFPLLQVTLVVTNLSCYLFSCLAWWRAEVRKFANKHTLFVWCFFYLSKRYLSILITRAGRTLHHKLVICRQLKLNKDLHSLDLQGRPIEHKTVGLCHMPYVWEQPSSLVSIIRDAFNPGRPREFDSWRWGGENTLVMVPRSTSKRATRFRWQSASGCPPGRTEEWHSQRASVAVIPPWLKLNLQTTAKPGITRSQLRNDEVPDSSSILNKTAPLC